MLALALLTSMCIEGHAVDDEKFDVRLKAAIGEVMVERFGYLFGVEIRAHRSISDEPLIFNVQDVTFEQFRELSARGLVVELRREPTLVRGSSTETSRGLRAMFGSDLVTIVASKELGKGYWTSVDRFLIRDRIVLDVKVRTRGKDHSITGYWEIPVKEGYTTFGFDEIPASLIEPYRAQIEEQKEMLRRIPPSLGTVIQ